MALAPTALTLLATVKDELGIADTSQDARLERYIETATAEIERYCGRRFSRREVTEKLRPSGTDKLLLSERPVVAVTSVKDGGAPVTDYEVDGPAGILERSSRWSGRSLAVGIAYDPVPSTTARSIEVVYEAGWVTPGQATAELPRDLPHGLEWACIETVKALHHRKNADPNVASEQLGDYSVSYAGANAAIGRGEGGVLPDVVLPTLKKYRRAC